MVRTMFLTQGRAADCARAEALLAGLGRNETVIGDRAFGLLEIDPARDVAM